MDRGIRMGRLGGMILCAWLLEFLLKAVLSPMALFLDPLFLLLIWLGLELPSVRFLWAYGMALGLLKETVSGEIFGAYFCVYGLMGYVFSRYRYMVEREGLLLQTFWTCLGSGLGSLAFWFFLTLADPAIGWNPWGWVVLPLSVAASGACAYYGFPRLHRFLQR